MKTEINQLLCQWTWEWVDRSAVPPGHDGTWNAYLMEPLWSSKLDTVSVVTYKLKESITLIPSMLL